MSRVIVALAILAWLAFVASRLLRSTLPELIVFLLAGALIGPEVIGVLTEQDLARLQGLTQVALAILMFMIGERVSRRAMREAAWIVPTAVVQYGVTGLLVYAAASWAGADRSVALLLAVLAGAGAPLTVASLVSSARVRSRYARGLVGVHAASDALAAAAFTAALPIATELTLRSGDLPGVIGRFLWVGLGTAVLGLVFGLVIARFGGQIETTGELLLFVLVHVLVLSVVSIALDLSLPLSALVMGAVAASAQSQDSAQRTFVAVRAIEMPLYLAFFALAGASIHFSALPELGLVGLAYVGARVVGKLLGGSLGGLMGRLEVADAAGLGLDLIPQAGVAVGLAVLAAEALPVAGTDAATVVLGSVVLFELVGPLLVSRRLSRRPSDPKVAEGPVRMDDRLPSSILLASRVHAAAPAWLIDWCARLGASLTVLGHADDEPEAHLAALRDHARDLGVPIRWVSLAGESFAGDTIRTAKDIHADLVIVVVLRVQGDGLSLSLRPHERIARHLECPVLVIPVEGGETDLPPRLARFVRRLP